MRRPKQKQPLVNRCLLSAGNIKDLRLQKMESQQELPLVVVRHVVQ